MKMERIMWFGVSVVVMLVFASSSLFAQGMFSNPSKEKDGTHESQKEEDPHRRFREGMMSPHGRSSGMAKHSGFSVMGLKESLELDDDQSEKLRQLFREYRKATILKKAELKVARIELEEAVADKDFNLANIEKKAQVKEKAATTLVMVRVKALAKAKDFLSKEQFEKFIVKVAHQMGKRKRHGGMSGRSSKHHGKMGGMMGGMMSGSPHGRSGGSDDYDD